MTAKPQPDRQRRPFAVLLASKPARQTGGARSTLVSLALHALDTRGTCRAYNLGCGGSGYSVLQVIDAAARVTGRDVAVTKAGRRPGDPAVLVASSDRIRRDLGWTPAYTSLDGIISSAWRWMTHHASVVRAS